MYIRALVRHRRSILTIWLLIMVASLVVFASKMTGNSAWVDNSVAIWFSEDDPELIRYEAFNHAFGEQEWTVVLLKTASIYDAQFLHELALISDRLGKLDHVVKVNSITNIRDNSLNQEEGLDYRVLYKAGLERLATPREIADLRRALQTNRVFHDNLINLKDEIHTVILVQNDNLIREQSPYRIELIDNIRNIISQYDSVSDFSIAGTTVINAELNRASRHDVLVFYVLISVLLLVFSLLVLKSWRDLLVLLSVVCGSVMPVMATIAFIGLPYNMMTVMLPTILLALGVAGVIHVVNHYHKRRQSAGSIAALEQTLKIVLRPGILAMLTTAAGFASLSMSQVVPVFQLGLFAACGIVMSWLLSITVAPVLLHLLWRTRLKPEYGLRWWRKPCQSFMPWTRSRWAFVSVVLLLPACGAGFLHTDTDYSKFFAAETEVSRAYQRFMDAGFGQNPVNILVRMPAGKEYSNADYFTGLMYFEKALNDLPMVIKTLSAAALIREIDNAFNGADSGNRLAAYSSQQLRQLLFLGELSGNDDINDLLLRDLSQTQILTLTPYMSSRQLDAFRRQVMHLADTHLPSDMHVDITGTTVLWANMDHHVSQTQLRTIVAMTLLLFVVLWLVFRSLTMAMAGLLVNALPLAIVLGIMGYLGLDINIATALIGGVTLGVVIDDSMHLLMRYRDCHQAGERNAICQAINEVGPSIICTTVIIAGGFATMMSSNFLPSAQFGLLVTVAVLIALLLDLLLLPQLLSRLQQPRTPVLHD